MLLLAQTNAGDLPLLRPLREGVSPVLRIQGVGERAVTRVLLLLGSRSPRTWLPSRRGYDCTRSVWEVLSRWIRTFYTCRTKQVGFWGRRKGGTFRRGLNRVSLPLGQSGDLEKEEKRNSALIRAKY